MDRLDQLIAASVRQGFAVRQGKDGAWIFENDAMTITQKCTPDDAKTMVRLIHTLRGAGLEFPEPHAERDAARRDLKDTELLALRDELRERTRRREDRAQPDAGLEL